jgi:uncharacterized membrane protein YfcA
MRLIVRTISFAPRMFVLPPLALVLPLAAAAFFAFSVETVLGFGATLITVAIGSFFVDLDVLLPAIAPLNLLLSSYLVARYHAHVDRPVLLGKLLPFMALGLPIGLALTWAADASLLKRLFGVFLVVVSMLELWRARRGMGVGAPLTRGPETALLVLGGAIHGAFMTGGPMAVYVASRVLHDKGRYRATLSALWAILNVVLLGLYAWRGELTPEVRGLTLALLPAIGAGMFAGELAFRRLPVAAFRTMVFVMLCASGIALLVRG